MLSPSLWSSEATLALRRAFLCCSRAFTRAASVTVSVFDVPQQMVSAQCVCVFDAIILNGYFCFVCVSMSSLCCFCLQPNLRLLNVSAAANTQVQLVLLPCCVRKLAVVFFAYCHHCYQSTSTPNRCFRLVVLTQQFSAGVHSLLCVYVYVPRHRGSCLWTGHARMLPSRS